MAAIGGIFRDSSGAFAGCFSNYLGILTSLKAELVVVMQAIEFSFQKGWFKLWLECDSSLVVKAFKDINIFPWCLRNRWRLSFLGQTNAILCFSHL